MITIIIYNDKKIYIEHCKKKLFQRKIICYPADLKCLVYSSKIFQLSLKLTLSNLQFQAD